MKTCIKCHKPIEEEKYACVWTKGERGIEVAFLHMACSEAPEFEDITDEILRENDHAS